MGNYGGRETSGTREYRAIILRHGIRFTFELEKLFLMRIYFGQIYIEPGVWYPFTQEFQEYLSGLATQDTTGTERFCGKYGDDFDIVFNISAKAALRVAEIKGPAVFKRDKTVEYSVFLPYDKQAPVDAVLLVDVVRVLLASVNTVLSNLGMTTNRIANDPDGIAESIVRDRRMTTSEWNS